MINSIVALGSIDLRAISQMKKKTNKKNFCLELPSRDTDWANKTLVQVQGTEVLFNLG